MKRGNKKGGRKIIVVLYLVPKNEYGVDFEKDYTIIKEIANMAEQNSLKLVFSAIDCEGQRTIRLYSKKHCKKCLRKKVEAIALREV